MTHRLALVTVGLALLASSAPAQQPAPPERGPEILSITPRYGFLEDGNGRTVEDVTVRYRLRGNLKELEGLSLEVREQGTGTVYWKGVVAAASKGSITIPKGLQFPPSPSHLWFSVANPDGATSFKVAGNIPTQVDVTDIQPAAVRVGERPSQVLVIGRGFTPESAVVVARYDAKKEIFRFLGYLQGRFIDSHRLAFEPSPSWFTEVGELIVNVTPTIPSLRPTQADAFFTSSGSRDLQRLRVTPAAAPILDRVEPAAITGRESVWLTLRGRQFTESCRVFVANALSPLISEWVSANEMKVDVPEGLIVVPGQHSVRVRCGDASMVSDWVYFEVTGGTRRDLTRPSLEAILPMRLPPLLPGDDTAVVRLLGAEFQPGAVAYAHVDERPPAGLATEFISPRELRVILTRELWGDSRVEMVLTPIRARR